MSPRRHRFASLVAVAATCTLLSGCFGSGGQEPTASHRTRHHRTSESGSPTQSPSTSSPTVGTSPPPVLLGFSPRSGGKHLDDCQTLAPGDDPAEFLYYPVLIHASSAVTLDSVATEHTQGVVDAGAWIAPTGPTPETGTFKGWPPAKIVTHDSNLEWGRRAPVQSFTLAAGPSYNVFLRIQVDPTPGDSKVTGLRFTYHDASGSHTETWKATTTFSMSCSSQSASSTTTGA